MQRRSHLTKHSVNPCFSHDHVFALAIQSSLTGGSIPPDTVNRRKRGLRSGRRTERLDRSEVTSKKEGA
jgi:hypothetical protein